MTAAAPLPTAPIALWDLEDLADADLDADLAQRFEDAGWVPRPGTAGAVVDPADLAEVIRRGAADALAAHQLGPGTAALAG